MLSANGIEQSISGTRIRSIRNHYEFMIFNRSTSSYSIRKKGLLLMMLPIFQSVGKMWGQPFVQRVGKTWKISRNTLLWLMTLINVRSPFVSMIKIKLLCIFRFDNNRSSNALDLRGGSGGVFCLLTRTKETKSATDSQRMVAEAAPVMAMFADVLEWCALMFHKIGFYVLRRSRCSDEKCGRTHKYWCLTLCIHLWKYLPLHLLFCSRNI